MNTRTESGAVFECDDIDTVKDIVGTDDCCCSDHKINVHLYDNNTKKFVWSAAVANNSELCTPIDTFNDCYIQKQE